MVGLYELHSQDVPSNPSYSLEYYCRPCYCYIDKCAPRRADYRLKSSSLIDECKPCFVSFTAAISFLYSEGYSKQKPYRQIGFNRAWNKLV